MSHLLRLTRHDPDRNMARFYALSVEPTLFGDWALVRHWGRIGACGQRKTDTHPTHAAALQAQARMVQRKCRRGYGAEGAK